MFEIVAAIVILICMGVLGLLLTPRQRVKRPN